jgi:hypothetical protein
MPVAAIWLLLAAAPATPTPPDTSIGCSVSSIPFAPPLDQPLVLTRLVVRQLGQGEFRQTVTYRVRFSPAGRGYRLHWQQVDQHSQGPPELLRLLALEEESRQGETLDFMLDETGALLGVTEAPDAMQRLAQALSRLRDDPAMAARPPRERAAMGTMLDRMAAMDPEQRAEIHLAKASRLLVAAGRSCRDRAINGRDGAVYRVQGAADSDGQMVLESHTQESRGDGSAVTVSARIGVSRLTGLANTSERTTVTHAGGVSRINREVMELRALPEAVSTQR